MWKENRNVQPQQNGSTPRQCPQCRAQSVKRTKLTSASISFACNACGQTWEEPHLLRIKPLALKAVLSPQRLAEIPRKLSR